MFYLIKIPILEALKKPDKVIFLEFEYFYERFALFLRKFQREIQGFSQGLMRRYLRINFQDFFFGIRDIFECFSGEK